MVKRRIIAFFSVALVGGQRHFEYLVELGMSRERIFTGYDVVDSEYFRQKAEEIRSQTSEVRQKHALPENYFLASARFIDKKNLPRLIRVYAEYRRASEVAGNPAFAKAMGNRRAVGPRAFGRWPSAGNSQLSTLNSELAPPRASSRVQAIRSVTDLLRFGEGVRACQHD